METNYGEHVDKIEVLSEIYNELSKKHYPSKEERDIAKLKMKLVKKEMLLLNYLIAKDLELINSG